MSKVDVDIRDALDVVIRLHTGPIAGLTYGPLLVAVDSVGTPNIAVTHYMTCGFLGEAGPTIEVWMWQKQYNFGLLMDSSRWDFTLNILRAGMDNALKHCGRRIYRYEDRFKALDLTPGASRIVTTPIIEECGLHFECEITTKIPVLEKDGNADWAKRHGIKNSKDPEFVIFAAEVRAAYADGDVADALPKRDKPYFAQ